MSCHQIKKLGLVFMSAQCAQMRLWANCEVTEKVKTWLDRHKARVETTAFLFLSEKNNSKCMQNVKLNFWCIKSGAYVKGVIKMLDAKGRDVHEGRGAAAI